MGPGPWYRIGLPLPNAFILAVIVESIIFAKSACHYVSNLLIVYHYGLFGREPKNLSRDVSEYPLWTILGLTYILQIVADISVWFGVVLKGNRQFLLFWIFTYFGRITLTSYLELKKEWGHRYEITHAVEKIFAFLWGSLLFGFIMTSGIQTLLKLVNDDVESVLPVAHGVSTIKQHFRERPKQLAVMLVTSEIIVSAHRSFNIISTPFMKEATDYLEYHLPSEWGLELSIATVTLDFLGLIFLAYKNSATRRLWIFAHVILLLIYVFVFTFIVLDWAPRDTHSQIFNGYVFISLAHFVYQAIVLYAYFKCCI